MLPSISLVDSLSMCGKLEQQYWFEKQEPTTQIEILKSLALLGNQSKTELSKSIPDRELPTINTVIQRMELLKEDDVRLIQRVERTKGVETKYSLTSYGIKILLENSYSDTDKNKEKKRVGKPYLNTEEFFTFLENYDKLYRQQQPSKEFKHTWKAPEFTIKELIDIYKNSNPEIAKTVEFIEKLKKFAGKKNIPTTLFNKAITNLKKQLKADNDSSATIKEIMSLFD